ncbi:hypothetical protein ACYSUW_15665 [Pseudomonas frederiksbergensis]
MTEPLLRLAYLAIGVYAFSSALLTQLILGRIGGKSAVEMFSMGSIWLSFVAFVLIVTWSSKLAGAHTAQKVPEAFLRISFLVMGLFFFACALASIMAFTNRASAAPDWFCVGGLWLSFLVLSSLISVTSKSSTPVELTSAVATHA